MTSYIADNLNIVFQRTKNILLKDIIDITYFMLEVNVYLRGTDDVKTYFIKTKGVISIPNYGYSNERYTILP